MRQLGRRPLVAALLAGCLAAAGCGGGEDAGAEADARPIPVRPGSPEEVAMTIAETVPDAKKKKDCEEVAEINLRSRTKFLCPIPLGADRSSLRRFELTASARFGARALLEFRSKGAPSGATMLLSRNVEGEWAVSASGLLPRSDASSEDPGPAERDAALERFLDSIRARDCDAWRKNAVTTHTDRVIACRDEFPATSWLTRLLAANPGAQPRYAGGNGSFGFFELDLAEPKPRRLGFALVETSEGSLRPYAVLDYPEVARD